MLYFSRHTELDQSPRTRGNASLPNPCRAHTSLIGIGSGTACPSLGGIAYAIRYDTTWGYWIDGCQDLYRKYCWKVQLKGRHSAFNCCGWISQLPTFAFDTWLGEVSFSISIKKCLTLLHRVTELTLPPFIINVALLIGSQWLLTHKITYHPMTVD